MKRCLKKVVGERQILMSTDLSKRSGTITMTNHYKRKLRLECGHVLWRGDSARVPVTAHCTTCAELS